ncbi:MAG: hypothetical protein IPJ04_11715 [Candidatus Eisenbacteria bacterium]|nr:hypothetical protein [Candidatus Eisenbacteria bacterium]
MSATDDARHHSARSTYRWTTLAFAALAGAAIGVAVGVVGAPASVALFEVRMPWTGDAPRPIEWAGTPRPGESAAIENGDGGLVLSVRAPRAPRAHALAVQLRTRREAGVAALESASTEVRERWISRLTPEPLPAMTPGAECAAWLTAAARRDRDLARALPAPWSAQTSPDRLATPVAVLERLQEVELAASAADPTALRDALAAASRASDDWFASGVPAKHSTADVRGAAWRRWTLERADSLDARAAALLAAETPLQAELSSSASDAIVVGFADLAPPAYEGLLRGMPASQAPTAAPLPGVWGRWLGAFAALGALVALLAASLGLWLRRRVGGDDLLVMPQRDPAETGAWLHVVAGTSAMWTTRAVLELAAHALARGERVLVVDGASKLRLHDRLGREARWGLMECLLADMPVLGLVQYGGRPGFYLLAHGSSTRGEGWARLGQRLDDVRPHFGRIILALDGQAPRAIGDSLAGRALEGWWADVPGRYPRTVAELSSRLGIAFSGMDLTVMPDVTLEALSGRVRALAPVAVEGITSSEALPLPVETAPAPAVVTGPVVLDCDLQVLQRLRFLAWMRRVQSESRAAEAATAL